MRPAIPRAAVLFAAALALWLAAASAAYAASPLAAIPIGTSAAYHVTTESTSPDSGSKSSSHNVKFIRASTTTIHVHLDGAPAGDITIESGGSVDVPPSLQDVLKPFGEVATYMRGAPAPLSPSSSWAANLPVPIEGTTDNVAVVLTVTTINYNGSTIVGNGANTAEVRPGLREFPTSVSVKTTMQFTPAHTLGSATRGINIVVHTGRLGVREKNASDSWTITRI